jgi:hypothetical protein
MESHGSLMRGRTGRDLKSKPVSSNILSFVPENPVPALVLAFLPRPAFIVGSHTDLRPKPFCIVHHRYPSFSALMVLHNKD